MNRPPLLLHAGALGDLALTIRLALLSRAAREAGGLDVVSRVDCGELGGFRPIVRRRSMDGLAIHTLFGESDNALPPAVVELLAGRCIINAMCGRDSAVHQRIARVADAIYSFDPRPRDSVERHITEQWRGDLTQQGLVCDEDAELPSLRTVADFADQSIVIHPGSGGAAKCWGIDGFLWVGRRLHESGRRVRFVLGPVEAERWSPSTMDAIAREFAIEKSPSIDELVDVLASAALLIGNDAGPAHLAALLGTPTLTVFGPTRATIWRPLGARDIAIQGDPQSDATSWGVSNLDVAEAARSIIAP